MKQNLYPTLLCIALMYFAITGCAGPISREVRKEADENLEFRKVLENPPAFHGLVIIWGGVIIETVGRAGGSELYLWETPLDLAGKPKGREYAEGEFIAKTNEFLDSELYTRGRKVTVAGEIVGEEPGTYQGSPYVFPVVKIKEVHLWKKEVPSVQWDWGETPYYWPDEHSPDEEGPGPVPR
jgi:outer membrane lipoprotein